MAYWFENYARIVFTEFGDRVKMWITINEPWVVAMAGFSNGGMAPGMRGPGILEYKAAHNLIRAHAKAYRAYKNEFAENQQGKIFYFSKKLQPIRIGYNFRNTKEKFVQNKITTSCKDRFNCENFTIEVTKRLTLVDLILRIGFTSVDFPLYKS